MTNTAKIEIIIKEFDKVLQVEKELNDNMKNLRMASWLANILNKYFNN